MQAKLFRNRRALLGNATSIPSRRARDLLLELLEAGIEAVQPDRLVDQAVRLEGEDLLLGDQRVDLAQFEHIWILGLGKASAVMARAIEHILGNRISGGCIAAPEEAHLKHIEVVVSGHPVPDERSIEAAEKMLTIARISGANDLVISLISGGGSALAELPIHGVSLGRLQTLTRQLLTSGADIKTINAVRQALSQFKGGGLARAVFPATHHALVISNVVGDSLATIASAPTVPMNKPIAVAATVLNALPHNEDLLELLEAEEGKRDSRIRAFELDALKKRQHNVLIGNNDLALSAICTLAKSKGLEVAYLRNQVEGEASVVARDFMSAVRQNMATKPQLFILGGQVMPTHHRQGNAGRNQALALAAVRDLAAFESGAAMAAMATDGIDYAEVAGAIVDNASLARANHLGMEPEAYFTDNQSFVFFESLSDQLKTGPTGTHVCDLTLLVNLAEA